MLHRTRVRLARASLDQWEIDRQKIDPAVRAEFDLDRLDNLDFLLHAPAADIRQYLATSADSGAS